jgi:hypothetical protein
MSSRGGEGKRSSFVVRVIENRRGEVSGVIERVATGAKTPFTDLDAIGQVIREMLRGESLDSQSLRGASPPPDGPVDVQRPELP